MANFFQFINDLQLEAGWKNFVEYRFVVPELNIDWEVGLGFGYIINFLLIFSLVLITKSVTSQRLSRWIDRHKEHSDFADQIKEETDQLPLAFFMTISLYIQSEIQQDFLARGWKNALLVLSLIFLHRVIRKSLVWFITNLFVKVPQSDKFFAARVKNYQSFTNVAVMVIFWVIVGLLVLSSIGVDPTWAFTSLGFSTAVIVFSLQNILADIFASFSVYLDKPFLVGDSIQIGDEKGHVVRIGLKSTRIKTLRGNELIIPNRELAGSRIHNLQKMHYRRVEFVLPLSFANKSKSIQILLDEIPLMLNQIQCVQYIRCNLHKFVKDGGSYEIEIVYRLNNPEYDFYVRKQQEINLILIKFMEEKNIILGGTVFLPDNIQKEMDESEQKSRSTKVRLSSDKVIKLVAAE